MKRKEVKIGIIGAGKIAERLHLPGYKETKKAKVVAICDIKLNKANRLAKMFKIPSVYKDYKKMIKEAGIDAVSVCTPNYLHASMTIFAAKNKKNVLVEKPMALSVKEMKAMINACKKNRVKLMVEQTQRFDPAHEVFKKVIESKKLGRIIAVRGKLGHSGPEFWSDDSPWFFERKKSGGGVTMDVGIHILDLIRHVTGKDVKAVAATMANLVKKKIKLEDNVEATLKFTDGTIGVFETSWSTSPYEVVVQVYGEKGKAIVKQDAPRVIYWTVNPKNPYSTVKEFRPPVPKKSKNINPCVYFVNCVIKKKKPFIDGVEGMKSMAVILTAIKSSKTNKFEKINI